MRLEARVEVALGELDPEQVWVGRDVRLLLRQERLGGDWHLERFFWWKRS